MVTESHDAKLADFRFHIRPNCSLSPSVTFLVYGVVGVIALAVALRFLFLGAWMVLPFTLLELGFLVWVVASIMRKQQEVEIITISDGEVHIVHRDRNESREWRFPHYWATVVLKRSKARNHPTRLILRSHGKEAEIGRFLTEEERLILAEEIKQAIGAQHHRNKSHSQVDQPTTSINSKTNINQET